MDGKSCFDVLAPSVTEMVALLSGHVPENWTAAIVISLLKKPGLDIWCTEISVQSVIFHSFLR